MGRRNIVKALSEHSSWDYTDRDNDQIMCNCGWTSLGFLPRTQDKAVEVFSSHQYDEIASFLPKKTTKKTL